LARIRFGVYLENDGPKLGPGKIQLLKAIREHGSISAAARSMGMAYRHAWRMLDELNHLFAQPVLTSTMGGPGGGGAQLTEWGDELIERFEEMDRIATASVDEHLEALESQLASSARRGQRRTRTRGRKHC